MKLPLPYETRKPSKTLAGVAPIAVMCKPRKCRHGTCLYCPSLNVPQSYTPKSPPVLRASLLKYDSYLQVLSRLDAFKVMNHPTTKIEIIIMGGNFIDYPILYQEKFVKGIYDALNGKISKTLEDAKKRNEKAKHRCVALCIETRPDSCTDKNIIRMLYYGCTRVEIGVQCLDDSIYKFINRGHYVKDAVIATKKLKNSGFKVGYHMMLGLPKSNIDYDLKMFKELFNNQDFKPDQLKIYPTQVITGSGLEKLYKKGKYTPYTKEEIHFLLLKLMKIIPNYCRVMRIMREIPPDYLIAGTERIDLRKDVEEEMRKKVSTNEIQEIRFREIGFALRDGLKISNKLKMRITQYDASRGKEYFLEFINKDNILFGLLRLRINDFYEKTDLSCPPANSPFLTKSAVNKKLHENKFYCIHPTLISYKKTINSKTAKINLSKKSELGNAIIREVHVYGQALEIGEKGKKFGQHTGLGKKLIKKAEEIAKSYGVNKIKVISGVGAREYYKKSGYNLDFNGIYMEKRLN